MAETTATTTHTPTAATTSSSPPPNSMSPRVDWQTVLRGFVSRIHLGDDKLCTTDAANVLRVVFSTEKTDHIRCRSHRKLVRRLKALFLKEHTVPTNRSASYFDISNTSSTSSLPWYAALAIHAFGFLPDRAIPIVTDVVPCWRTALAHFRAFVPNTRGDWLPLVVRLLHRTQRWELLAKLLSHGGSARRGMNERCIVPALLSLHCQGVVPTYALRRALGDLRAYPAVALALAGNEAAAFRAHEPLQRFMAALTVVGNMSMRNRRRQTQARRENGTLLRPEEIHHALSSAVSGPPLPVSVHDILRSACARTPIVPWEWALVILTTSASMDDTLLPTVLRRLVRASRYRAVATVLSRLTDTQLKSHRVRRAVSGCGAAVSSLLSADVRTKLALPTTTTASTSPNVYVANGSNVRHVPTTGTLVTALKASTSWAAALGVLHAAWSHAVPLKIVSYQVALERCNANWAAAMHVLSIAQQRNVSIDCRALTKTISIVNNARQSHRILAMLESSGILQNMALDAIACNEVLRACRAVRDWRAALKLYADHWRRLSSPPPSASDRAISSIMWLCRSDRTPNARIWQHAMTLFETHRRGVGVGPETLLEYVRCCRSGAYNSEQRKPLWGNALMAMHYHGLRSSDDRLWGEFLNLLADRRLAHLVVYYYDHLDAELQQSEQVVKAYLRASTARGHWWRSLELVRKRLGAGQHVSMSMARIAQAGCEKSGHSIIDLLGGEEDCRKEP
eukprot:PhM_4_TR11519/c0_g1_i1/m.40777